MPLFNRLAAAAGLPRYRGHISRGRTDTLGLLFTAVLPAALRDPAAVAFLEVVRTSSGPVPDILNS